jgi:hypothetical protein
VQHQRGLLLLRFDGDKPHARSRDSLANGGGIIGVILIAFHVGFDVVRRHQSHVVAQLGQLACPVMRCGTGLDPDPASGKLLKER